MCTLQAQRMIVLSQTLTLMPSVCTLQVQRMVVLTQTLTPSVCTLQVQRMVVPTQTLTPSVCKLQAQRMIVLNQMLTSCVCTLQVQRMVDEYKDTNSHILKQCIRISEMLLINIPVGKLFEGLDFANEQVESFPLLLLLPLVVAASAVFGSLLLLCIICVFSCLRPQGLLLMKSGRRISDVCNNLGACCACEGETGTSVSGWALAQTNQKVVLLLFFFAGKS